MITYAVTNLWLAGPAPDKRLDRDRLEERILNLLSSQNICVLATSGPSGLGPYMTTGTRAGSGCEWSKLAAP
jgi:hypothetical protein